MDNNNLDWTGNKKSTFVTLGASSHAAHDRQKEDYYATDPKAAKLLCDVETFTSIWEPACVEGHLSKEFQKQGYAVYSSDLVDRGYGKVFDFLSIENQKWYGDIVTNPPYKYAQEFVEKALAITTHGHKIAMFLKLTFLEGKARKEFFRTHPPRTIYVSSSRIQCAMNGVFNAKDSSAVCYAWFVWENGYKGETTIKWIN